MDNRIKTGKELFKVSKQVVKGISNERQLIVKDILEKVNIERLDTKYRPLTPRAIAVKVGHIKTPDLRDFYYSCLKADCGFSRAFWHSLKV